LIHGVIQRGKKCRQRFTQHKPFDLPGARLQCFSMPELPEVETTKRGIAPHLIGHSVAEIIIRRSDLRLPIPDSLAEIAGFQVLDVQRRAKYLIIAVENAQNVIIHLGMSGSLRVVHPDDPFRKHDHVAFTMSSGKQMRYHDPRRFGMVLHVAGGNVMEHPLFQELGPEPLDKSFSANPLFTSLRQVRRPIKTVLMDPRVVVGVGNIYASESLFHARIRPTVSACNLSRFRIEKLVKAVKEVLARSIEQGGTTLRDFVRENGEPGYFRQELFVYERAGQPCRICGTSIEKSVQAQRSTYDCPKCQRP
jgi:formamidopyrimidine-DNA glycosylase